jgi:hypothetical protein
MVFSGFGSFPLHLLYHISGWMHCYYGVFWFGRKHYVFITAIKTHSKPGELETVSGGRMPTRSERKDAS